MAIFVEESTCDDLEESLAHVIDSTVNTQTKISLIRYLYGEEDCLADRSAKYILKHKRYFYWGKAIDYIIRKGSDKLLKKISEDDIFDNYINHTNLIASFAGTEKDSERYLLLEKILLQEIENIDDDCFLFNMYFDLLCNDIDPEKYIPHKLIEDVNPELEEEIKKLLAIFPSVFDENILKFTITFESYDQNIVDFIVAYKDDKIFVNKKICRNFFDHLSKRYNYAKFRQDISRGEVESYEVEYKDGTFKYFNRLNSTDL